MKSIKIEFHNSESERGAIVKQFKAIQRDELLAKTKTMCETEFGEWDESELDLSFDGLVDLWQGYLMLKRTNQLDKLRKWFGESSKPCHKCGSRDGYYNCQVAKGQPDAYLCGQCAAAMDERGDA